MSNGEFVNASDVRREVHKAVYPVLVEAEQDDWRIRRQGHKFRLYCPCGGGTVRIDGTPRSPDWAAKQARRKMRHCPDRHD